MRSFRYTLLEISLHLGWEEIFLRSFRYTLLVISSHLDWEEIFLRSSPYTLIEISRHLSWGEIFLRSSRYTLLELISNLLELVPFNELIFMDVFIYSIVFFYSALSQLAIQSANTSHKCNLTLRSFFFLQFELPPDPEQDMNADSDPTQITEASTEISLPTQLESAPCVEFSKPMQCRYTA